MRQASLAFRALGRRTGRRPARTPRSRLLRALLRAYPDRVARMGPGDGTCTLAGGGGARLDPGCRVRRADWILALEAEAQSQGAGTQVVVRTASRVEPDWLLDAFPEAVRETETLAFNPASGRVDLRATLWFQDLCLDESRRPAPPGHPGASACLARAALQAGLGPAQETVDRLLERCAFLGQVRPDLGLPPAPDLAEALVTAACEGLTSLKDLAAAHWPGALRQVLGGAAAGLLDAWAPDWVALPKRRVKVHYGGEAPWIASRLQDFLGLQEGPRVAGGSVALVLHLLAPNQRAVQVTTDLRGFWQRAYQELRPSLSRRYPRHLWPEDPAKFR